MMVMMMMSRRVQKQGGKMMAVAYSLRRSSGNDTMAEEALFPD